MCMSLWSHRCTNSVYGDNSLDGCKQVVEYGFTGIEVDVQYHAGKFYLHHDHWYLTNETLDQLLNLNLGVDLWIDMKTSESIDKLIPLFSNFTNRLLVEVYDEKMVLPLQKANITVAGMVPGCQFHTVGAWQYIFYGLERPAGTWDLDMWCLNDMFFADGGDIVLTNFYKPSSCAVYFPGRWSLWSLIALVLVGLLVGCFCTQRKKHVYKRFHVNESGMYTFT